MRPRLVSIEFPRTFVKHSIVVLPAHWSLLLPVTEQQFVHENLCICVYLFSGGTEVTIQGSNLDSVAEPHINLTVIITRFDRNSNATSSETYTSSEAMRATLCWFPFDIVLVDCGRLVELYRW